MLRTTFVWVVAAPWWLACATGGTGSNPPLPGGPDGVDGGAPLQEGDAAEAIPGDDASTSQDDAGPTPDSDSASNAADTCNDLLHGLQALGVSLLGPHPAMCAASPDCPAGQCCYVSATASACVMK